MRCGAHPSCVSGAGGGFSDNVLDAGLTPRLVQPTTIGRADGREERLAAVFRRAHIPCQIVPDMHVWLICHLGMVAPIADAYYDSDDPEHAGSDKRLMRCVAFTTSCTSTLTSKRVRNRSLPKCLRA